MKHRIVRSIEDLDQLEALVLASAESTTHRFEELIRSHRGVNLLAVFKFSQAGCDPLDHTRRLNLIEQLNQSFTYLASIAATRWLFVHHSDCVPFILNLGTKSGLDITSENGNVAAETFAATRPESNRKLKEDIAKVGRSSARHKYVFFLSPIPSKSTPPIGVQVVRLDHAALSRLELPGV